jgi:pimeloyl-ACP methyl ester carboxylesterase
VQRFVFRAWAVAAVTLLAACASGPGVSSVEMNSAPPAGSGSQVDPEPGTLQWGPCDSGTAVVDVECATLAVPLDHDRPDGETIEIALARVRAGSPDRIGSLVFNPGGPGGSGIDFLTGAALLVPEQIADRFDLVSFDPRGVGRSTALDCDVEIDDNVALLAEGDDAGWAELVAEAEQFTSTCTDETLELAPFVGTDSAARDLDLIREALGDDQLSYVGFSYGTRLGAAYAERFPQRVRALVLDGGVKPTDDLGELDAAQGRGFDLALENFAAACDADPDCILSELGPALDVYTGLVDEITEEGGFPTSDPNRVLTPGELKLGVAAALYSTQTWPVLAEALYVAETNQDGSILHALVDAYAGRRPDGSYDNRQVANVFVNCADDPSRPPVEEVRRSVDEAAAASRHFADFLRAGTRCIGLPASPDPLALGPADGAAPILVLGNTGDPATPFEWSRELAEFLSSGVLYTVEAEGHTAFLSVDCVDAVVIDYLVDLELPAPGSGCSDSAGDDRFLPEGEGEFDLIVALFDCLRENGADVPELGLTDLLADPSGESWLDGFDPSDPAFIGAVLACGDLLADL